MNKISLGALALAISIASGYAGTITTYANVGAFDTAVGAVSIDTFNLNNCFYLTGALSSTSSFSCSSVGSIASGSVQPGVTYSVPNAAYSTAFAIDSGLSFSSGFLDANISSANLSAGSAPLTVTFSSPVSAVAWDELNGDLTGYNVSILLNFVGGGSASESGSIAAEGNSAADAFFGFQSSAADISSVVIDTNSAHAEFEVDNFTIPLTSNASVPEPGQFLPMIGVLTALALIRYRSK